MKARLKCIQIRKTAPKQNRWSIWITGGKWTWRTGLLPQLLAVLSWYYPKINWLGKIIFELNNFSILLTSDPYLSSIYELIHLTKTHIVSEEAVEIFIKMWWWILRNSAVGHIILLAVVPGILYELIKCLLTTVPKNSSQI